MTGKAAGTADVTVVAWVENRQAADHMVAKFGAGARSRGTLVIVGCEVEPAPDPWTPHLDEPGFRVQLRYRHTCKNQGNGEWDTKRFFEKTFPTGTDDERFFAVLEDVMLNDWERLS
jgi:hypothetical protein